jgi:transposase-like protein
MEKSKTVVARRRWSPAERARWLREYRASGMSQEKFAEQAQLSVGTLRGWIYRRAAVDAGAGGFAPVQVVGGHAPRERAAVTVRWPHGVEVELAVDLGEAGLRRLMRELVGPCSR